MAVGVTHGTLATSTVLSGLQKPEVLDKVILKEAHIAPIYSILRGKAKKELTIQYKYEHYEDQLAPLWATVDNSGSAVLSTATSIPLSAGMGDYFNVGDVAMVPSTGEQMLVTAQTTSSITVTRGYGTTAAADIADTAYIVNTGPAKSEGADPLGPTFTTPTLVTNYVQEFSKTVLITDIQEASETYGGPEFKRQLRKKRWEILRDIELRFLLGEPKDDSANSRRATGGLNHFYTTNVSDYSAAFDEDKWNAWLEAIFALDTGSTSKLILGGGQFIRNVMSFLRSNYTINVKPATKEFGMDLASYISPFGKVTFAHHRLLTNDYASWAFAVDLEYTVYRYMKGLDLKLQTVNLENPHKKEWEYYAVVGFDLRNEAAGGKIITP